MQFPRRKYRILEQRRPEGFESKGLMLIREELSSFPRQFNEARRIAETVFSMFQEGISRKEDFFFNGRRKVPLELRLEFGNFDFNHGEIFSATDKRGTFRCFVLTLYVKGVSMESKMEAVAQLTSIVAHELMHCNVNISMEGEASMARYYKGVVDIISNGSDGLLRDFAYAMYATFYQERRAIVSSTTSQLEEMYFREFYDEEEGFNKPVEEEFNDFYRRAIVKTEAYQIYFSILKETLPALRLMSGRDRDILLAQLKRHDVVVKDIGKEIERIGRICKGALKDICRNGTIFYYEEVGNGTLRNI